MIRKSHPALGRALLAVALVMAAAGAGGCFSSPDEAAQAAFEKESKTLSPQCVSLADRIPYRSPDSKDACGLSCLDMICAFEHREIPEALIGPLRQKAAVENGVTVDDIVMVLQSLGFRTLRKQGAIRWPDEYPPGKAFEDIGNPLSQIHFGRPVIVRVMTRPQVFHFMLLVGFDAASRKVILQNPGTGPVILPLQSFDTLWAGGDRVFIAYKHSDVAPVTPAAQPSPSPPPLPPTLVN
ncbi:MAG: cysteine peptidase family C39 domain-containing protein [Planctomycetota bacterium]